LLIVTVVVDGATEFALIAGMVEFFLKDVLEEAAIAGKVRKLIAKSMNFVIVIPL
jgi:hypothetical protein